MPDTSKRTAILKALSPAEEQAIPQLAAHLEGLYRPGYHPYPEPLGPDGLPIPPVAPGKFQPDPMVVGDPHLAQFVQQLLDRTPNLKAKVPSVISGPDKGVMEDLDDSGYGAHEYPDVNLLGETDLSNNAISLNPRLGLASARMTDDPTQANVLAHELTHVAGARQEKVPHETSDLWEKLLALVGGTQPAQGGRGVR